LQAGEDADVQRTAVGQFHHRRRVRRRQAVGIGLGLTAARLRVVVDLHVRLTIWQDHVHVDRRLGHARVRQVDVLGGGVGKRREQQDETEAQGSGTGAAEHHGP
jgi:hypothetical protein